MHDEHPHPLLAQIPLTISPFLSLPTATPLPYTYKQLPSTLPPSILSNPNPNPNSNPPNASEPNNNNNNPTSQPTPSPAYVSSASGDTTATPDAILQSCLALQSHLRTLESSARNTLLEWEDARKAADLAEKRRVAPGWLDAEVKLLVPENVAAGEAQIQGQIGEGSIGVGAGGRPPQAERRTSVGIKGLIERRDGVPDPRAGEELDRVFGGLGIK
ncbi:uncharacterized protein BDR25DRAFT_337157 [Lindgomyces ingoldianus]|uniref:Uncharacterized protein n=1 Tax=Lindgomyces ingoldianus TaxID=673940 RepID=A0ACB6QE54_9PLEO|nr:uncharacterized protein BDR25DRAFT_337157 [Lindgomyces ingoldianus]KAF2465228.1 hypothetical protein BDR25DRAFT_337157 [Lindgomyces ingoldianus]